MTSESGSKMMNVPLLANYLGKSVPWIRKEIDRINLKIGGDLPPIYRIGGGIFFKKEDVDKWIESKKAS